MERRTQLVVAAALGTAGILAATAFVLNEDVGFHPIEIEAAAPSASEQTITPAVILDEGPALQVPDVESPATDREAGLEETSTGSATLAKEQRIAAAVSWLKKALPQRFGDMSAEEIERLTDLDLRGAEITDADLAHLSTLLDLKTLGLRGTAITDVGLDHLWSLGQLESLELRGTAVTGLGLPNVPAGSLTALHLTDTKVTGEDLYRLPPMPNLQTLKLNWLKVDDMALETLAAYPSLRHLELDQTGITDAGLEKLLQFNPNLTRLELRRTAVTDAAVKQLKQVYPNCEFVLE